MIFEYDDLMKFLYFGIGVFVLMCVVLFVLGLWLVFSGVMGYLVTECVILSTDGVFEIIIDILDWYKWILLNFSVGRIVVKSEFVDLYL